MHNIKKLLCLGVMCLPLLMQAQGTKFEEGLTWKQVLEKAKKENKYIFVDCYATWCAPCKWMDENVYTNDTVGRFFNDKFISIKVQMDTSKGDDDFTKTWYTDASRIMHRYKVRAFPTYLFFSPNGDIVHRETGAKPLIDFITVGMDALNLDKQYYAVLEKYRRSELDTGYMKNLAGKVKSIEGDKPAVKIANDYINRLPNDALFTKDNLRLMVEFTKSSKDRGFTLFRDSAERISKIDSRITESNCKVIVLKIINNEEIEPYKFTKKGKPDWKRIKANLKKYGSLGEDAYVMFAPKMIFDSEVEPAVKAKIDREKIKSNLKRYGSLGEDAYSRYVPGLIYKIEIEPALKINSDWSKILMLIDKQKLGKNAEFVVGSTVVYYLNGISAYHTEKNCKNFVAAASYYADSFPTFLRENALNSWAWAIFEHSNEKDELKKALAWSTWSLELKPNMAPYLDTYANLLYKLGHVQEAIEWQEKAVSLAKNDKEINDTLIKMKKGEKTWPEK